MNTRTSKPMLLPPITFLLLTAAACQNVADAPRSPDRARSGVRRPLLSIATLVQCPRKPLNLFLGS
ncbi:MAG TPA: hypothetical protein PKK49_16740, partial [Flavobacteriales bacterium]|nr:hypothetical protein [Flavobacteriales bacterium]